MFTKWQSLVIGLFFAVVGVGILGQPAQALPNGMGVIDKSILSPVVEHSLNSASTAGLSLGCGDVGITDVLGGNVGALITDIILCPIANGLFNAMQEIVQYTSDLLLKVDPLLPNGQLPANAEAPGGALYFSWRIFRDFANVALVIAILFVIFSQATSVGLNAYGIKKMLPKILIAAIMINISYFVCAVLVDIFNILGKTIGDTFESALSVGVTRGEAIGIIFSNITDSLGGIGGSALILAVFLIMILAFLVMLLLSLFALFFVVARQIFIVFLILVSPLAFAAWILPNTEKSFARWWSVFIKLLAIYPIVTFMNVITLVLLLAVAGVVN